MKMYLFAYDVSTEDKPGQARLRQVAKACESRGSRVQKSLFECRLKENQFEDLKEKLLQILDLEKDSLRIYLLGSGEKAVKEIYGLDHAFDFTEPLIF